MMKHTVLLIAVLVLAGCGAQSAKEITETRTVTAPSAPPQEHPNLSAPSSDNAAPAQGRPAMSPFSWELPPEWSEVPPKMMRVGNFTVKASPETECLVTILKGVAGGVDRNVNMWRQQMGQPELKSEEVAALSKIDVLGHASPLVECTGAFTGKSGQQQQQADYMLLGVICPLESQTVFIKMTGPESVVRAEKDRFVAFCQSLKEKGAASNAGIPKDK